MASKTIFSLLFIAFCAIQIYAECPHSTFWVRHVCHDCEREEDFAVFARRSALYSRTKPSLIQTIYKIPIEDKNGLLFWEQYKEGKKTLCRANLEYQKVECKIDQYKCVEKNMDYAEHSMEHLVDGKKTCPDQIFAATQLCYTCQNEMDIEIYKNAAVDDLWKTHWRPTKDVAVFVLGFEGELKSEYWETNGNMCKLKEPHRQFECSKKMWACDMVNIQKGRAVHILNMNGHLVR